MASDIKIIPMLKDFLRKSCFEINDRFVIRDGKKHKCAIICPGGGYYTVCSYIEGVPVARKLNKLGISAFIIYYRVKEEAVYPNPQDDLAKAIEEISKNAEKYQVDMDHYSIWGASAGGHLVGSFGTEKMGYRKYSLPKPGALILSYPVISLEKEYTHQSTRDNHIGAEASKEREKEFSVYTNVDDDYPPTYIWCGDADDTVTPENTKMMDQALKEHNIPHICTIFPEVKHGVGPATGTSAEGWINKAVEFWLGNKQKEERRMR